jgi:hypothetical protein
MRRGGALIPAQGVQYYSTHDYFGRAIAEPELPLRGALRDEHFDAGDGLEAAARGDAEKFGSHGAIDHVHDNAAIEFIGAERRAAVSGHADGRGVDDGVEFFVFYCGAKNRMAPGGLGEFVRLRGAARGDDDGSSSVNEGESGGASGSAGSEDEDAAAAENHAGLESAENADVIGVVAE